MPTSEGVDSQVICTLPAAGCFPAIVDAVFSGFHESVGLAKFLGPSVDVVILACCFHWGDGSGCDETTKAELSVLIFNANVFRS